MKSIEVISTKRKGIVHLQNMKDQDFINFVNELKNKNEGKLKNIPVSLKIDGCGGRAGKDKNGRVFFEGSRTGPIFEPKSFSSYAKSKGVTEEILTRSLHYDDLWELITNLPMIKSLPNDSKVIFEILYNPMGHIEDNGITFVSIKYDKRKLGSLLTLIPFDVVYSSNGEKRPDSKEIINDLINQSNDDIMVLSPKLKMSGEIDINIMIEPVLSLDHESLMVLNSRKKKDKEFKGLIKMILQKSKESISKFILNHQSIIGKDMLGSDIEGLVLDINGHQYKVTTNEFKQSKGNL